MQRERRNFAIEEVRVAPESGSIEGYAAVFGADSVDMGFIERIAPGAFKRSIESGEIIHALWNHNSDFVLGSTRSGKLALSEDSKGLHFRLDASRLTAAQVDAVKDGDMRMSFGFSTRKDQWEVRDGKDLRTLLDVNLFEVSPVAMPAYPDTSVAMRSLEAARSFAPEGPVTMTVLEPVAATRLRMKSRLIGR
jgi:HK97 family phage prohead protease